MANMTTGWESATRMLMTTGFRSATRVLIKFKSNRLMSDLILEALQKVWYSLETLIFRKLLVFVSTSWNTIFYGRF